MRQLRVIAVVAAAALLLAACGGPSEVSDAAAATNGSEGTGITVSGEGRVEGVPDTARLTVGISVLADTAQAAQDQAAGAAQDLLTALEGAGIEEQDIQTTSFSVFPEYDFTETGRVPLGFRVSNDLSIVIRDVDRVGEVLDAATGAAGDQVTIFGLSFEIDDDAELVKDARAAAWEDAREKASQLADLAGVSLGDAISMSETLSPIAIPLARQEMAAAADAATPILEGQVPVSVTIQVTFAIG